MFFLGSLPVVLTNIMNFANGLTFQHWTKHEIIADYCTWIVLRKHIQMFKPIVIEIVKKGGNNFNYAW